MKSGRKIYPDEIGKEKGKSKKEKGKREKHATTKAW